MGADPRTIPHRKSPHGIEANERESTVNDTTATNKGLKTFDLLAPETVIPQAKRAGSEPDKEGRFTTRHSIADFKNVGFAVDEGNKFRYQNAKGGKPAYMFCRVDGLIAVHSFDGVQDQKFDGTQNLDIEVCATVVWKAVKQEDGTTMDVVVDAHVYLNVRKAESGEGTPTRILSVHNFNKGEPQVPKGTIEVFAGAKGVVAVRERTDFLASRQRQERPTLAQPLGAHLVAALGKNNPFRDPVSLGGAQAPSGKR